LKTRRLASTTAGRLRLEDARALAALL
jgi:hypothetical protein